MTYRLTDYWGDYPAFSSGLVREVFRAAVKALSHSPYEEIKWMEDLESSFQDAFLALLLPALVRLKRLDLSDNSFSRRCIRMLRRAICKEKPFDSHSAFNALTEVTITCNTELSALSYRSFPFSFQFPSIRGIC